MEDLIITLVGKFWELAIQDVLYVPQQKVKLESLPHMLNVMLNSTSLIDCTTK